MLTEQQERYITSRGEHLEELIAEGNPLIIIGIINRGLGTEYYEEWLKHGIEIERILERDGAFAISTCIREGLLPERYDEWKDKKEEWILETFAENGYYLDELIESEYDDVREIVIENHPDFCIERLNQGKIYQMVHDYIINETKHCPF